MKLVEASLVALRVTNEKLTTVTTENSPEYDSQGNGAVENGIRNMRAQFRAVRLCLEARIGKKLPITHALMTWMVEHVCLLMNAIPRGGNGMTPWERVRGRKFNQRIFEFGELVVRQRFHRTTSWPAETRLL